MIIDQNSSLGNFIDDCFAKTYNSSALLMNSSQVNWINVTCEFIVLTTSMFTTDKHPIWFVACVLFAVLGVFGNCIVLYVIGYRKKKRNSGDAYILILARTDFLFSLIFCAGILSYILSNFSHQ